MVVLETLLLLMGLILFFQILKMKTFDGQVLLVFLEDLVD